MTRRAKRILLYCGDRGRERNRETERERGESKVEGTMRPPAPSPLRGFRVAEFTPSNARICAALARALSYVCLLSSFLSLLSVVFFFSVRVSVEDALFGGALFIPPAVALASYCMHEETAPLERKRSLQELDTRRG